MSLRTVDAAVSDSLQRVGLAVVAGLLGTVLLWAIERWAGDWARPGQLRKQFRAVPAALAAAFKPGQVRAHAVLLLWLPWPAGGSLRQAGQAACALPGLSRYCCRDKKRGALPAALLSAGAAALLCPGVLHHSAVSAGSGGGRQDEARVWHPVQ